MYFVNQAVTLSFELPPSTLSYTATDLDTVVTLPDGVTTYTNANVTNFVAPTALLPGSCDFVITPTVPGRHQIELTYGALDLTTIVARRNLYVISSLTFPSTYAFVDPNENPPPIIPVFRSAGPNDFGGIATDETKIIATGYKSGATNYGYFTYDMQLGNEVFTEFPDFGVYAGSSSVPFAINYANGVWTMFDRQASYKVWYSSDGSNWTLATPTPTGLGGLTNFAFYSIAQSAHYGASRPMQYSTNGGVTWTNLDDDQVLVGVDNYNAIINPFGGNLTVVLKGQDRLAHNTTAGFTGWVEQSNITTGGAGLNLEYWGLQGGTLRIYGSNQAIRKGAFSTNGTTWTSFNLLGTAFTALVMGVHYLPLYDKWFAVCQDFSKYESSDGITWAASSTTPFEAYDTFAAFQHANGFRELTSNRWVALVEGPIISSRGTYIVGDL